MHVPPVPAMTQLDDNGTVTDIVSQRADWTVSRTDRADTFWQHWTPATQRDTMTTTDNARESDR